MKRLVLTLVFVIPTLSACVTSSLGLSADAQRMPSSKNATVLINMEEGYLSKSGQAVLLLSGGEKKRSVSLRSLADQFGGPGEADRIRKGGIYSYRAMEIPAGEYKLDKWFFRKRRGRSLAKPNHSTIKLAPGKVYYIGHFFADNIAQKARLENSYDEDMAYFKKKFAFLNGVDVMNVSSAWLFECWPSSYTNVVFKDPVFGEVYKQDIKSCFPNGLN